MRPAVRDARPRDAAAIRRVVVAAFDQADEADLVESLRAAPGDPVMAELVAEDPGSGVVGHVLLSWLAVEGRVNAALALAPVAVAPEHQGVGVGAALVRAACARAAGVAVIVLGDPAYYGRFGFTPAAAAGLIPPVSWPADAWRVAASPGVEIPRGAVRYPAAFGV